MALSPGTRLGPYEISAQIGVGGMGEVYRAFDTRLGRTVAIKVSRDELSERVGREARAIATLNHPNVCQIYDVGPNYLVLEYIEGRPLDGPLPIATAVRLALQVASGIEAAHERGILHRDLKPANILVTKDGTAKLLDFGIAQVTTGDPAATRSSDDAVRGTVAYMSPEQANGASLDARSDIFSFGAVLYEAISGRRSFAGDSAAQVLSAVLRDEPAPLDAPPAIARVVSRLLAKLPEHRFQTMADVRRALEEAAADASAKQRDPRPSIAVLPFANLSGDTEQEYFADGVSEDIITELSRFRSLFVIARNSSFTYRGRAVDVRRVSEELGVRWVLEGSVRKMGNRVRVAAQLIDARDGHHVWAERYDRELADLFDVQDDITRRIVGEIAPGIMMEEVQRAQRMDPAQLNAWDSMLRARWHIMRFTRDSSLEAIRLLERSIAQDSSNAPALSDLAFVLHFASVFGWSASPRDDLARMADVARRAVTVDDKDDTAQAVLGVSELFSGRHDEAARRLQRALHLNPNSSFARGYLGVAMAFTGDRDAAIRHSDEAIRLSPRDPLLVIWYTTIGWARLSAEDYEQAIDAARQAIDCNPEFVDGYVVMAAASGLAGRLSEARPALESLLRRMPGLTLTDERLHRPFKKAGDQQRVIAGLRVAGLHGS